MAAIVDSKKCNACETCVDSCPVEAIEMKAEVAAINADDCTDCETCIDACPEEAISME